MTNKQIIHTEVRETSGLDRLLGPNFRASVATNDGSTGYGSGSTRERAVADAARDANKK